LASARIVYLDVAALAPAACLVQKLGRAGAALLGQKLDPERLAARLEDLIFGVGVLREEIAQRLRRPDFLLLRHADPATAAALASALGLALGLALRLALTLALSGQPHGNEKRDDGCDAKDLGHGGTIARGE